MSDKFFLDSNIIVYSISNDEPFKSEIARRIMRTPFLISPQIIFEYMNVCRRKLGYSKEEAISLAYSLLRIAVVVSEDADIVNKGLILLKKLDLSFFDSKIVATALLSGCTVLYSEDLHHGLVIENQLRIVNPFIKELNK